MHMQKRLARLPLHIALVAVLVNGCGASTTRLDEAMMVDDAGFKMKVVRYFERLPFSSWGEIATVQCASDETRNRPAGDTNDQGWAIMDRFVALGTRSASDVLGKARERILFRNGKTLVWNHGMVLSFTFDGCGHFKRWDARKLPEELTLPAQLPDDCKPKGLVDCSPHDFRFIGNRMPVFSAVEAIPEGHVSFEVRSTAFVVQSTLRVRSTDYGRTWVVEK